MNYYKHHLGDYDGHTAHLSWDEDMAYTRLLRAYYRRESPIQQAEAYRIARASSSAQKRAVDSVLAEFFNSQEDGWHNKRADEEISAFHGKANANRENGKLGGRPKPKNNPRHNPNGTHDEPTNNLSHKPVTKNQEPSSVTPKRSNGAAPDPAKLEIWATGRALLVGQGVEKDEAGAFLGKLVKDYGEKKVLDVVRIAATSPKADLKTWLVAACQERSGKQGALEARNAAVVAEALKHGSH